MTSDSFHIHTTRLAVEKVDHHEGIFFVMKLDWFVFCVACLEFSDQTNSGDDTEQSYRDLTFFTAGIIDLYQSDDETKIVNATTTSDDRFIEALPIDEILAVHPLLYAIALYKALRNEDFPVTSIRSDEVSYALSVLSFKEVLHASITLDELSEQLPADSESSSATGQKLAELISTVLTPVPGSDDTVFYYHGKEGSEFHSTVNAEGHTNKAKNDDVEPFEETYSWEELIHSDNQSIGREDAQYNLHGPPLYFRFTFTYMGDIGREDETPVSLKDIRALKSSAELTAKVSVFEHTGKTLPRTHTQVIRKLQHALDEFASEQTLDKYRFIGSESLNTEDFKIIMRNLSQSKHYVLEIPINFYVSKSSSMIKASDPTAGVNESDLDHGYHVLLSELESSQCTTRANLESFLIADDDTSSTILLYWCFVEVKKSSGSVVVRVHHPLGHEAAQERAERTKRLVKKMLDRSNQRLLLESMYKTRKAPAELFADGDIEESKSVSNRGMYACPVQYQHELPLHRRVSPAQAVRTLHSSILQNFMLSNRSGFSVYRDESNNIYYMNLIYRKNTGQNDEENSHVIELLVYGIEPPGQLITEELVRLLQRRLLLLPLDAISSLLNKNPQYNLLATDMSFINNFSRRLKEIEPDIESNIDSCVRKYELPSHVQDPLTFLLMFRQNLCGSTFMQLLHQESDEIDRQFSDLLQVDSEDGNIMVTFPLPGNEFCFFFNSLGLGLDPAAQHVTTLTEQGRIYSRQAGSGIAIIQASLLHGSSSAGRICVGKWDKILEKNLRVSKEYISLIPTIDESKDGYKVAIKVTNTTVDIDVIHKWVHLSLSQALAAYTIERHRESYSQNSAVTSLTGSSAAKGDREGLNQLMPGLPPLEDMMTITVDLPHPAMMKIHSKKMLQATSLATLTLDLTEKAILGAIFNKSTKLPFSGLEFFRLTNTVSRVSIVRDRILKAKVVSLENEKKVIKDIHTDSPEYICVFGLRQSDGNPINSQQHLFFKEIHVPRPETSAFAEVLNRIKSLKPALFERHVIFILRVSRSYRSLMTCNISPHIWAIMKTNFTEIEGEMSRNEETRRERCVGRCMEKFPFVMKNQFTAVSNEVQAAEPLPKKEQPSKEESVVNKGPVRRIKRPTTMLKPTLIGKSVDGAAAQAVQASRLRAKAPQRTGSVSKLTSPAPSTRKKQPKDKLAQQKQRDVGRSIVQSMPTTNMKFYRDLTAFLKEASESHLAEPILTQSVLQQITHTYFASIKDRESPLTTLTRLISNCYGSTLCCGTISLLPCDDALSSMKSFVQFVAARWKATAIQSPHTRVVYLQKDLLTSRRRRSSIMMEILVSWDGLKTCYDFHYKAILLNSSDGTKKHLHLSRAHAEEEAAVIDAISQSFIGQLKPDCQILNFAGSRLATAAKTQDRKVNTLALLRCTAERFSEHVQSGYCLEGHADYMLQRRFLAPSSVLGKKLLEIYDRTKLFQHFSSDCQVYKLNDCSGAGEQVFSCGMRKIAGLLCHIFIAAHETVDSALEVFTLCLTRGERVDAYVAIEGSPFTERLCDVVLGHSMSLVEEIITSAAINMRNEHLWRSFGSDFVSSIAMSEVLMDELRQCCQQVDLMNIEPRLQVLFADDANELLIPWVEIFQSFNRSALFHCIRFDRRDETNWVVYSRRYDTFIDIVAESSASSTSQKQYRRVQLILKDDCEYELTAKNASDQFVSFVLNRIWAEVVSEITL